jgi:hypothetical protein
MSPIKCEKMLNNVTNVVDPEGFIPHPDLLYNLMSLVPGPKVGHDDLKNSTGTYCNRTATRN